MIIEPRRLRGAAREQADVGSFVSDLTCGPLMIYSGAQMDGLATESACRAVGTAFDDAIDAVLDQINSHADKLTKAAGHYQRTDEEYGRRLRSFGS